LFRVLEIVELQNILVGKLKESRLEEPLVIGRIIFTLTLIE